MVRIVHFALPYPERPQESLFDLARIARRHWAFSVAALRTQHSDRQTKMRYSYFAEWSICSELRIGS
jgi:hypothetical protein